MGAEPPAVAAREVRYRYGKTVALDGASLEVARGTLHALVGRNGAGKSTLIGCLTGLLQPRGGTVAVLGRAVGAAGASALSEVGVAFETAAFYGELSGETNLRAFAELKGLPASEADGMLARLGIAGPVAKRAVSGYSLGTRQRLNLARAFLGRPSLVILDEPFNALDPDGVVEVRRLILERRERDGAAFLISSHNLLEMERLADRVAIVHAGKVVRDGAIGEVVRGFGGHVRVEVADAARAKEILGDGALREGAIEVKGGRDEVPGIVERLVGGGVRIYEVREVVPTLEDVFRGIGGGVT